MPLGFGAEVCAAGAIGIIPLYMVRDEAKERWREKAEQGAEKNCLGFLLFLNNEFQITHLVASNPITKCRPKLKAVITMKQG